MVRISATQLETTSARPLPWLSVGFLLLSFVSAGLPVRFFLLLSSSSVFVARPSVGFLVWVAVLLSLSLRSLVGSLVRSLSGT